MRSSTLPPTFQYPPECKSEERHSGFIWYLLGILSFIGAILLFVGSALPTWRRAPSITYHVFDNDTPTSKQFYPSSYGLYFLSFNSAPQGGGASRSLSRTWYNQRSNACTYFSAQNSLNLFTKCSKACQRHLNTRCSVYHKINLWGYFTLATLISSGCFVFLGSVWTFVFSIQHSVLMILWLGSAFLSLISTVAWIWISGSSFNSLQMESQYPYPTISSSVYIVLTGIFLISVCGVVTLFLACNSDREYWHIKQNEVNKRALKEVPLDNPMNVFNNGLMSTMSQPHFQSRQLYKHPSFMTPYAPLPKQVPPAVAYPNAFPPTALPHSSRYTPAFGTSNLKSPFDVMKHRQVYAHSDLPHNLPRM